MEAELRRQEGKERRKGDRKREKEGRQEERRKGERKREKESRQEDSGEGRDGGGKKRKIVKKES